jgi:tetratricopeptide (TPR) repeat protein
MFQSVLILFLSVQAIGPSAPGPALTPDEFKDALAHAEALYYEAQFKDAIQLLMRIDDELRQSPGRLEEKAATKLQLALANVGLGDVNKAREFLRELFDVSPDYPMDPEEFSPKVVALAIDARKEEKEVRCHNAVEDSRKLLQGGNAAALLDLITTMKSKCAALSELEPSAAELFYKRGLDAYKKGEFKSALQDFRTAVKVYPKHELASDYAELAESNLQLTAERLLLQWQKDFDARQFADAALKYHEMSRVASAQTMSQIQSAYREALTALVESWNRACPTGDTAAMQGIRSQIDALLPYPDFGADIRAQMSDCSRKSECVPTNSYIVMKRLKTRVNPEITREMRSLVREGETSVRVQLRIDEKGNVTVNEVEGYNTQINNAVRAAVERWKFNPAADATGAHCVDTEIIVSVER